MSRSPEWREWRERCRDQRDREVLRVPDHSMYSCPFCDCVSCLCDERPDEDGNAAPSEAVPAVDGGAGIPGVSSPHR